MNTKVSTLLRFLIFLFVSKCDVVLYEQVNENFRHVVPYKEVNVDEDFHIREHVPISKKSELEQHAQFFSKPKEDFIFGKRTNRDFLIDVHVMKKESKFLRHVVDTYEYPATKSNIITCIKVLDVGNTGGHAVILSGGIGKNYVTIQIKSKLSSGFIYNVEIYVQ